MNSSPTTTTQKIKPNRYPRRKSSFTRFSNNTESSGDAATGAADDDAFKKEIRAVICLRIVLISIIVIAASVFAGLVYKYVKEDQHSDFETAYREAHIRLSSGFHNAIDTMVASTTSLSAVFTTYFGGQSNMFPFVTADHFQEQASGLLNISKARALEWCPLVTQEDRVKWESYAVNQSDVVGAPSEQLAQGIYMKDEEGNKVNATGNYTEEDGTASRHQGLFSPVWQIAPTKTNEGAFLFDLRSQVVRRRAVDDMIDYKVPTLTSVIQLVQDGSREDNLRPSALLFNPVFDSFDNNSKSVVGSTLAVFNWDTLLENILPNNVKGLIVVMETSTGEIFTFGVDGEEVTVLGEGDLHDSKYDKYEETTTFPDEETTTFQVETYTIRIYPSSVFEDEYVNSAPAVYTTVIVLIFFVTATLFLLYDYISWNHRDGLTRVAKRANAIVDSMFPHTVKDRLFRSKSAHNVEPAVAQNIERDDKQNVAKRRTSFLTSMAEQATKAVEKPALKMKRILLASTNSSVSKSTSTDDPLGMSLSGAPIADLFDSATVMFADIAGFTNWSSKRDPADVFKLLENLFKVFDDIATNMGVFKISTIGDCYLAVTGLPDETVDHAEIMAEFAEECLAQFANITELLAPSLGEDVLDLKLRIGIHSGQVTAGVLRGLKARFEIFGDTVNTASRMESTGAPSRIQVSQETADLLIEADLEEWLTPRERMVAAKGKGQLQTYWLSMNQFNSDEYDHAHQQKTKISCQQNERRVGEDVDTGWVANDTEESSKSSHLASQLYCLSSSPVPGSSVEPNYSAKESPPQHLLQVSTDSFKNGSPISAHEDQRKSSITERRRSSARFRLEAVFKPGGSDESDGMEFNVICNSERSTSYNSTCSRKFSTRGLEFGEGNPANVGTGTRRIRIEDYDIEESC